MSKLGIYQIKNLINNKIYIGSSKTANKRLTMHRHLLNKNIHTNYHLQSSWNKYGESAFEFKVIQFIENESDLLKYEQTWIDWTKCYNYEYGYNINKIAGSNIGYKHTDEHKLHMSNVQTGRIKDEKTRLKTKESKSKNGERKLDKWPHEKGCQCKCSECYRKRLDINNAWKRNSKWWIKREKTII